MKLCIILSLSTRGAWSTRGASRERKCDHFHEKSSELISLKPHYNMNMNNLMVSGLKEYIYI